MSGIPRTQLTPNPKSLLWSCVPHTSTRYCSLFAALWRANGGNWMILPETYQTALFLMILSMLCWGSWANTLKLCPGYRFQLFYWDYAIGLAAAAVVWGLTAGNLGHSGPSFIADVASAPLSAILFAVAGGVVFNIANLLLVAAIDVAGLAVAFPVGIGLALVVGAVSSYIFSPAANPLYLFGGVGLVVVAIVLDAAAYRKREATAKATTTRGIVLSLVAGLLMGGWYPIATHGLGNAAHSGPGPYAIAFYFAIGVLLSTIPANLLLMAKPLDGKPPVDGSGYWRAPFGWHLAGICRRRNLVRRRRCQLCRLRRASGQAHWPRCQLLHWPGSHHDLRLLGRLCLARICRRSPLRKNPFVLHVHLFPVGPRRRRPGSALLRLGYDMKTSGKPIVVVGSINMDLVAHTRQIPVPGQTVIGTGFRHHPRRQRRQSGCRRRPPRLLRHMVGAVGEDVFGQALLDNLAASGVDTTAVARVSGPSGVAPILLADKRPEHHRRRPRRQRQNRRACHRSPLRPHPLRRHGPLPA